MITKIIPSTSLSCSICNSFEEIYISREFKTSINSIANDSGIDEIKKNIENSSAKSFTDEMRDSINQSIIDDEKKDEEKD